MFETIFVTIVLLLIVYSAIAAYIETMIDRLICGLPVTRNWFIAAAVRRAEVIVCGRDIVVNVPLFVNMPVSHFKQLPLYIKEGQRIAELLAKWVTRDQ